MLSDERLARFLRLSAVREGAQETTGGMVLYDPYGRRHWGEGGRGERANGASHGSPARDGAVLRDGEAPGSGLHGGDGRRSAGARRDGPRARPGRHHAPEDCWGRYSATEIDERRRLARQLSTALAASSPDGLLWPPALRRLGELAGYDLPTYAVSCAGGGLDPEDEEDFSSVLDFLDSAGGIHFCNEDLGEALRRLSAGMAPGVAGRGSAAGAAAAPSGATPADTATGPAPARPLGAAPRPAAASASREAGAAVEARGSSGRRWDYSRFDAIRDSSDEEA